MQYQVNAITKPNRYSEHEHITHIGNNNENWRITRESAISRINSGDAFYVINTVTNQKVYIEVVPGSAYKAPYLRTRANGQWTDNLLSLPECTGILKR